MKGKAPRYDLPNAAPPPLDLVQAFVNTINPESGEEWLRTWLGKRGAAATTNDLAQVRDVREALRELLYANNGQPVESNPHAVLERAADAAKLSIDFANGRLVARSSGVDGAVGAVLAAVFVAMRDGNWRRLKACRNRGCRWAFYDNSKNVSAAWCSMQLCGNRNKTRAYRARRSPRP